MWLNRLKSHLFPLKWLKNSHTFTTCLFLNFHEFIKLYKQPISEINDPPRAIIYLLYSERLLMWRFVIYWLDWNKGRIGLTVSADELESERMSRINRKPIHDTVAPTLAFRPALNEGCLRNEVVPWIEKAIPFEPGTRKGNALRTFWNKAY